MATIRLSSVKIGEKNIRFLYFRKPNQIYVTSIKSNEDVPLFLGGDILATSNQANKNFCRIHSRYAKDGMATKLTFKGIKIEGINHSSNLWFYTVQGLFAAAFEHLGVPAQRDCLLNLRDVWISKSYGSWSPENEVTVSLLPEDIETSLEASQCNTVLTPQTMTDKTSCPKDTQEENPSEDITFEDKMSCRNTKEKQPQPNHNNAQKISQSCSDRVSLVRITEDLVTNNCLDSDSYNLLLEILNEYHSVITDCDRLQDFDDDIPVSLNVLLCVIGNCLGHNFNSFKESIAKKVDIFKMENINQIDNLPSAEDLVTLLFPQCMQVFMLTWMSTKPPAPTYNRNFSPSPKKRKLQEAPPTTPNQPEGMIGNTESQPMNVFPFIQLILEFANNVLISGVAHVLYSRLLHST